MRQAGWSVGHPTYIRILFLRTSDFGVSREMAELLKCWFSLRPSEAVSFAQYQGRFQHSVDSSSRASSMPSRRLPGFAPHDRRVQCGGGSDPRLLRTVYGKQRAPSRAVWRADEWRRKTSQQPDSSITLG